MIFDFVVVGDLQVNCYLVGDSNTKEAILIDPGDNARTILKMIEKHRVKLQGIYNTHAHFDHVLAVQAVREATGTPFYLHALEEPFLRSASERAKSWLGQTMEMDAVPQIDAYLEPGQEIRVGDLVWETRFVPGHSPGSLAFICHSERTAIVGDTLFPGGIGRFDLPGADGLTLVRAIREQLMSLSDDYKVYPGHGPATTIGVEREQNPYLQPAAEAYLLG